jgi:exopolysaccharide production protein ExoQ
MNTDTHFPGSQTNRFRRYGRPQRASRAELNSLAPKAMLDKYTILPIAACSFALIVFPLLSFFNPNDPHALEGRPETRIFWPVMAAISVLLMMQNRSRLALPPNIFCLLMYLAFAGVSVMWAFSPDRSFIRYLQQVMIVTSIVPSVLIAGRNVDVMRALFICFVLALILNIAFGASDIQQFNFKFVDIGYRGYFGTKNPLGECASVAFLLSIQEVIQRGWRKVLGLIIIVISVYLVFLSHSKTAFALALVCPLLAWIILFVRKITRVSPAIVVLSIIIFYLLVSKLSNYDIMGRISYILYNDSTLTGRTIIWDYVRGEISRYPVLGWGYQSFWLVPGSPSLEAPGFVKMMPNAHNGYYDTMLEMGYVGFGFLSIFIMATLHAVGRVADRDLSRARFLLSLALFFILYNFFESLWMRAFEVLWVVFLVTAAEIARYWRPLPLKSPRYSSVARRSGPDSQSPKKNTLICAPH